MSEVARITGISGRTLRHYDETGLLARKRRTDAGYRVYDQDDMIRAVDAALAILRDEQGGTMDMKQHVSGFDPAEHEAEVQKRWGDTEACRESATRTKRYGEDDWRKVQDEQAAIYANSCPCSAGMHANLAVLWEADPRYAETIDAHGAGLTAFLAAAVRANARRYGG